jgi:hypothetical protein
LDVKAAPNSLSDAAKQKPPAEQRIPSALGWTVLFFAILWALFYALSRGLPYLKNGSDIVFSAKLKFEEKGQVFPSDPSITRVLIFGNSKSQAPNVLLLTIPWDPDPPRRGIFHFIPDDHAVIDDLFPFRNSLRDLTAFLLAAPSHGGVLSYYRESKDDERAVIAVRGYHLITEQSHFPGGRLPDDFRLGSDQPAQVRARLAPAQSAQLVQLNQLVRQYHIDCYYVPFYLRQGEAAPAAPRDERFAALLQNATSCKLLGPDYFLYPNRLFADQTHLNEAGARVYTQALFQLLKESPHALQ